MRNILRKVFAFIMGILFLMSGSMLDSQNWFLFLAICMASLGVLLYMAYQDGWTDEKKELSNDSSFFC